MKDKSFADGLKNRVKIKDRKKLVAVMIMEALDKGFIDFDKDKMIGYTTFRNLFDEVKQKYDVLDEFEKDKEQIETEVIKILEKDYNIIFESKRKIECKENSVESFDRDEI